MVVVCLFGELQVLNALQYHFKIFSGAIQINDDRNRVLLFLIICISLETKHSFKM